MAYVTAVTASPSTGDEIGGNEITLTLSLSAAVTVTGSPTLSLNDGGLATYDDVHSTTTNLIFTYTVASENTPALAITGVNGTVTDNADSSAADFSAAVTSLVGLQVNNGWATVDVTDAIC